MGDSTMEMVCDLQVGDTVGYRLHNTDKVIKNNPARVVSKTDTALMLDNGLTLTTRDGHWVLKLKDRYGTFHATFYKL